MVPKMFGVFTMFCIDCIDCIALHCNEVKLQCLSEAFKGGWSEGMAAILGGADKLAF